MIVLGILCHFFTLFCGRHKPTEIVWPHNSVRYTASYLPVTGQLLTYLTDTLRDPSADFNSSAVWMPGDNNSNISVQGNTTYRYDDSRNMVINESFDDQDKLAVIHIIERNLMDEENYYFKFSLDWDSDKNARSIADHKNNSSNKDSYSNDIIINTDKFESDDKKPIISTRINDIFYSRSEIEELRNDSGFNGMIESLAGFEKMHNIDGDVEESLMFDEILHFLSHMNDFFENYNAPARMPYDIGYRNRIKISDIINLLNRFNYKDLSVDSFFPGDEVILNVNDLIDSMEKYENLTAVDDLLIPMKINDSDEKIFKLSSIVKALSKTDGEGNEKISSETVTTYGDRPYIIKIISGGGTTDHPQQPETDDVLFILTKMQELLTVEAKVRKIQSKQGFEQTIVDDLTSKSFNDSAQQVSQ